MVPIPKLPAALRAIASIFPTVNIKEFDCPTASVAIDVSPSLSANNVMPAGTLRRSA